jgi:SAM-dependent methyltransferase
MTLPFSAACERNKAPILERLRVEFGACLRVLEVGSGTGQHAVHFARGLPHLAWQLSEVPAALRALRERVAHEAPPNVLAPVALDVRAGPWPAGPWQGIFSANTLHIMGWRDVEAFFRGAGAALDPGGVLCVYGPFRYGGLHTSASNAEFDMQLRAGDPLRGVRDFEAVDALAREQGLLLHGDHALPANNRLLAWSRAAQGG